MDGLQDLGDLLNQYDWREVASIGVGTALGLTHAIYDKYRGNEKKSRDGFIGAISGGLGGYHASTEGFLRGFGNGFLGGLAYGLVYDKVSKLLDRNSRDSPKE